jgi:hypothetical protein
LAKTAQLSSAQSGPREAPPSRHSISRPKTVRPSKLEREFSAEENEDKTRVRANGMRQFEHHRGIVRSSIVYV